MNLRSRVSCLAIQNVRGWPHSVRYHIQLISWVRGCVISFLLFLIIRFSLHSGYNRHCSSLLRKAISAQPWKLKTCGPNSIFPKNSKHNYILMCRDLVHFLYW